jgi:ATP-dependent Lhr-like helicase
VLFVERGGRGLLVLDADRAEPALAALAEHVRAGRLGRMALERVDGEPVIGSDWEARLIEHGFRPGPRKLSLSA